jgi:hypothetical protein
VCQRVDVIKPENLLLRTKTAPPTNHSLLWMFFWKPTMVGSRKTKALRFCFPYCIHGIVVGVLWLIVGSWLGLLVVVAPFGFAFVWWKRYVVYLFLILPFQFLLPFLDTNTAFLVCLFSVSL